MPERDSPAPPEQRILKLLKISRRMRLPSTYCEITIFDVLVRLKERLGTNGTERGNA
jgi:hypothetical protein